MTGFHSVIDRPERVSRVIPPTTTIAKISAQQANSHAATAPCRVLSVAVSPRRAASRLSRRTHSTPAKMTGNGQGEGRGASWQVRRKVRPRRTRRTRRPSDHGLPRRVSMRRAPPAPRRRSAPMPAPLRRSPAVTGASARAGLPSLPQAARAAPSATPQQPVARNAAAERSDRRSVSASKRAAVKNHTGAPSARGECQNPRLGALQLDRDNRRDRADLKPRLGQCRIGECGDFPGRAAALAADAERQHPRRNGLCRRPRAQSDIFSGSSTLIASSLRQLRRND